MISYHAKPVDPSFEGARRLAAAWAEWLQTPLHLLKIREPDFDDGFWQTVARALIAIPFATGLISLRNYVKSDYRRGN